MTAALPPYRDPDRRLGAVVLTGGSGSRLGGADKASLVVDGEPLLARALAAAVAAEEVVVVGVPAPTLRPVVWTQEEPPGGGPAAGLLAGLDRLSPACDLVAVLAVDMPRVTPATFERLIQPLAQPGTPAYDGVVLVDRTGRRQPLCAVYRRSALAAARPRDAHGLSMRRLVEPLRLVEVAAEGAEASDVDTWEDLARLGGSDGLPGSGGERQGHAR